MSPIRANRVPLPDRVSRSPLRSDRSAGLENAEHAKYSSLDALERAPSASSVPRSSSITIRSGDFEDARRTRHSSLDTLERVPLGLRRNAPESTAALTPILSPIQHGNPPGDTAVYEQSTNGRIRDSIEPNVPNDSDLTALPSFAEKMREMQ